MVGFIGSHFEVLVLAAFGLFAVTLACMTLIANEPSQRS